MKTSRTSIFAIALAALALARGPTPCRADDSQLAIARQALDDELYDLARKNIESFLESSRGGDGEKFEAAIILARAMGGQGEYLNMLAHLDGLADSLTDAGELAIARFWSAAALFGMGKNEQALEILDGFEGKSLGGDLGARILKLRAGCLTKLGQYERAVEQFGKFDELFGETAAGAGNAIEWARALNAAGRPADARSLIERKNLAAREDSAGWEATMILAESRFKSGEWPEAAALASRITAEDRQREDLFAQALFLLADVREAETKPAEGAAIIEAGIENIKTPRLLCDAKLRLGRLLFMAGETERAAALLAEFVESAPDREFAQTVQLALARSLSGAGSIERAVEEYQRYLELFPETPLRVEALKGKGFALFDLGSYSQAAEAFARAGELSETRPDIELCLIKAADSRFAEGRYELASKLYSDLADNFKSSPYVAQARHQIAECEARSGALEKAEKLFLELASAPAAGEMGVKALIRAAELAADQGKLMEAASLYARVLKANPEGESRAGALYGMGAAQYRLGLFDEASANFEMVFKEFPKHDYGAQACCMQGWCRLMAGDEEAALDAFNSFLKLYPQSPWAPDVIFRSGELAYNSGNYADAESRFRTLAEKHPDAGIADTALFWAGRAALMQKEYRRAHDTFVGMMQLYPKSGKLDQARFYQAEALCELGEFSAAILVYEELIRQFPDSVLAEQSWIRKGDAHFTLGTENQDRYAEAIAAYSVVLNRPESSFAGRIEAEYKIGRCSEKRGAAQDAFDLYMNVVYHYLRDRERASALADVWFTRAAFSAAQIMESGKAYRQAVQIYERVIEAGVPAAKDAAERIRKIKLDNWWFFY